MAWETDEVTARARLERAVAWEETPALTVAEVDDLLTIAKRTDRDGITPTEAGWTPTWDVRAAAAEGWRWKMGKASAMVSFSADGATFNRDQFIAHCEKMIRVAGGRNGLRSTRWGPDTYRDPLDAPVIGNLG